MPIRLILADDHPLILNGLKHVFSAEQDFEVMDCCANGEEALRKVRQHRPDVLILDLRMPIIDGMAVLRDLHKERSATRVILLTEEIDEDQMLEALRLDVRGVVLKEMAPQLIVTCVRKVHAGGQWLEKNSIRRAMEKMLRREAAAQDISKILTSREIEIVSRVAQGMSNKAIADHLSVSEGTIKTHLHNVYKKLEVDGRLKLILYARGKGLV
ncbi:MAG: response regulator [Thermodesulfobacteriota bacterium]